MNDTYQTCAQAAQHIIYLYANKEDRNKEESILYNQAIICMQSYFKLMGTLMKMNLDAMEGLPNANSG